jgi:hypothetical protein
MFEPMRQLQDSSSGWLEQATIMYAQAKRATRKTAPLGDALFVRFRDEQIPKTTNLRTIAAAAYT